MRPTKLLVIPKPPKNNSGKQNNTKAMIGHSSFDFGLSHAHRLSNENNCDVVIPLATTTR